jgi:hypothetical protein
MLIFHDYVTIPEGKSKAVIEDTFVDKHCMAIKDVRIPQRQVGNSFPSQGYIEAPG